MNPTSAIVMSAVIATGATIINKAANKQTVEPRTIIGGFIVGAILLGVAEIYPEPARMLALLIALTSVLINGEVVFGAIARIVNG